MVGHLRYLRKVNPAEPPSWYAAANADEWTELANSMLSTSGVGWSGTSPGGFGPYTQVVIQWSGGFLNTIGQYRDSTFVDGTFLNLFGGGHSGWGGNEIYAFGSLLEDAPAWYRHSDPTIPAPTNVDVDANGYPVSRHTYDTLQHLPTLNKLFAIGAPARYNLAGDSAGYFTNDFATDPAAGNPWGFVSTGYPAWGSSGAIDLVSAYNATTGKVWGLGKGNTTKLASFDVATLTWTSYSKNNPDNPTNIKGAIDEANNLLAYIASDGSPRAADLNNPATTSIFTPTTTGTGPTGKCAIEWDSAGGRFVCWPGTGKTLYFLTPGADPVNDDWAWTGNTPAAGATPADQTANGTYGRFRMVQNDGLRGLLVMPTYDAPICFYRMG